ncbi:MAG: twin-arginine translocase subunit TatB [Gammaproteobacteria bacterium]|nr:twin-arginine translocase subunit TatB [Gammaproteobacteria bacterium]
MFDIGFSEILIISVVAILVVGPKEFPALVRTFGRWMGKARSVAGEMKNEFQRELAKTEELTRKIERESEIAELHKVIDETKATIPINAPMGGAPAAGGEKSGAPASSGSISSSTGSKPDGGA